MLLYLIEDDQGCGNVHMRIMRWKTPLNWLYLSEISIRCVCCVCYVCVELQGDNQQKLITSCTVPKMENNGIDRNGEVFVLLCRTVTHQLRWYRINGLKIIR